MFILRNTRLTCLLVKTIITPLKAQPRCILSLHKQSQITSVSWTCCPKLVQMTQTSPPYRSIFPREPHFVVFVPAEPEPERLIGRKQAASHIIQGNREAAGSFLVSDVGDCGGSCSLDNECSGNYVQKCPRKKTHSGSGYI